MKWKVRKLSIILGQLHSTKSSNMRRTRDKLIWKVVSHKITDYSLVPAATFVYWSCFVICLIQFWQIEITQY